MARKGNPIAVRLDLHRSSDSSWFSDYYYGKFVYQDVNLRSYFGSIRPPTILTFGFRLGRCIILHFPKWTFIHFFLPRRPLRLFLPRRPLRLKRRDKSRPGKAKGRWWAFGKVERVSSFKGTEEVGGRAEGKREESIRLDDREKQNEIRIRPKKMQRYGYHDRSPSRTTKSLRVSGEALKHPTTYAAGGVVNDIASLIERDDSSIKFLFKKCFFPIKKSSGCLHSRVQRKWEAGRKVKEKSRSGSTSHLQKRTLPGPSLNYLVMQYLFHNIKKMHFDPAHVLNHFVASGVAEPGGAKEESLELRIRSRIAFFVESSTSETKYLAQAKKRLIHFIRLANDLRFAGTRKKSISLFPFFGATFFFPRDGLGVKKKNLFLEYAAREKLLYLLRIKCWNLMGKNKVMELIEKFIDLGRIGVFIKGIEIIIEIILRKRIRIPYNRYNLYLNEVKKMRSFLSNRTKTNTLILSVKIKSVYQSASLIAKDISLKTRKKKISFRSILSQIVKDIPFQMPKGVVGGIRISCSGRLGGAEIARTECGKYGKTSCNVFHQKIDYGSAKVFTRNGILGVKVRISYSQKKGCAISETYEI